MIKRARAHTIACLIATFVAAFNAKPLPVGVAHADVTEADGASLRADFGLLITGNLLLEEGRPKLGQQKSASDRTVNLAARATAPATETHVVMPPAGPAPARFFTINQVLAKQHQTKSDAVHVAAIDPKVITDGASPAVPSANTSDEPFGLFTFRAPEGLLWAKWKGVEATIQAESPALARCRADADSCTPAAARFLAIVKQAEGSHGRAKLELVNERVNAAIHYMTDMEQWHVADLWSAPLDTEGKGSFDTGKGDCEDYAIAKYVALREAGVPAKELRLLLVRDKVVNTGHAVLAARENGHWLIMDNRFDKILAEADANFLAPLFAMDAEGVKLFAAPYASRDANQHLVAGSGAAPIDGKLHVGASWGE